MTIRLEVVPSHCRRNLLHRINLQGNVRVYLFTKRHSSSKESMAESITASVYRFRQRAKESTAHMNMFQAQADHLWALRRKGMQPKIPKKRIVKTRRHIKEPLHTMKKSHKLKHRAGVQEVAKSSSTKRVRSTEVKENKRKKKSVMDNMVFTEPFRQAIKKAEETKAPYWQHWARKSDIFDTALKRPQLSIKEKFPRSKKKD